MSVSDDIPEENTTLLGDILLVGSFSIIVVLMACGFWAVKVLVAS